VRVEKSHTTVAFEVEVNCLFPVTYPPLHGRSESYLSGGDIKTKTVDLTTSADELVAAVLRDKRQVVQFSFRAA
jgi:hypothetical protein